ncbi:hypothetical protein DQ04_10231010 [Trypanosoma grayi]|uniref:hypothetical protein n=1 Tax=Trypanosoma grayi TaxID=71804 RepID=UPI0004F47642|nr:hypothetical protein DQ04_10231010 [Trypanosoma grayi]KEG07308.1 hypothetical protein DQ04_10231010 [Trypanosoma grayi]
MMDDDDIYRDEESTTSLSQLQGRRSLRLDPLPDTPPPPTPLKSRDANTTVRWPKQLPTQQQQQQRLQRRQRACGAARTAPTSPVLSRPRVGPARRPLTPTPATALPATLGERHQKAVVRQGDDDSSNTDPQFRVAAVDDGDEGSLMPSSRWVSFSFASGLTSRRQSESRPSSPSPRPRAAIMPSSFPDLHFSDDDGGGDETMRCDSARAFRTPTVSHDFPERCPANEQQLLRLSECAVADVNVDAREGSVGAGAGSRGSLLLLTAGVVSTAAAAAEATTTATSVEAYEKENVSPPQLRHRRGKRERSVPPSPTSTSLIICGGFSSCGATAAAEHNDGDGNATATVRWQRMDVDAPPPSRVQDEVIPTSVDEFVDGGVGSSSSNNNNIDAVRLPETTAHNEESLLLVSGPTPTPWRQRFAAAGKETHASEVMDVRCSDTVAAPVALFGESFAVDTAEEQALDSHTSTTDINKSDTGAAEAATAVEETTSKVAVGDGRCAAETGEMPVVPHPPRRPSDDLMALVEAAREEVRRASERLVAALEAHRHTSSEKHNNKSVNISNDNTNDGVDDVYNWIGGSVQLSLGGSSAVVARASSNTNINNSSSSTGGDGGVCRPWVPPESAVLRRELTAHAGRILRRLRGYDRDDVGALPMVVVARVVQQVLVEDEGTACAAGSQTPARGSEGCVDVSWCIASPSPSLSSSFLHVSDSPTAACRNTWEKVMARQKARMAEESAMRLYVSLWSCFRECFGERYAAQHLGVLESNNNSSRGKNNSPHAMVTSFPRVRQQMGAVGQQQQQPPLNVLIDYKTFAASLAELS